MEKVGIDPHFSYALMAACVAWCRVNGTTQFILPNTGEVKEVKKASERMPGLPENIAFMIDDEFPKELICGRCEAYDPETKLCSERDFKVSPADPGCDFWLADPNLPAG